ncbi:MAG: hypothetical protein QW789_05485, partial [Nitrososphaerota archaeon]
MVDVSQEGKQAFKEGEEAFWKVLTWLEEHQEFFSKSIPLIASENVPSPAVREALISDFGNRYAE